MNRILISIIGPTSIGKTNLTIKLAKYYKTEILSCDSKQFYKELKIGTSRPTQKQLKTIKHHFIGNLNVKQDYNIYKFYKDINKKLKKLFKKYNILFMVGGSCLYETTIIEGINYIPKINKKKINNYRNKLNKINIKLLLKELKKKDNFFFNFILKNKKDKRKIIRALEVLHFTKKKFSFFLKKKKN
ncbi:MAG: hypothetical protein NHG13_00355 [Candidatus Shikimatogenerans bostrichidophilus]|nr:MAG: hypothetical protein NHG13_00355 [Candidatus Shikimatogenerans bostrichidophilus]